LTNSGAVRCWGENSFGQLGDSTNNNHPGEAVQVFGLTNRVTSIVTGARHTCAIRDGAVLCWGDNRWGQLGDGSESNRNQPVQVNELEQGVVALASASDSTCALLESGGVRCWGRNLSGELGDGSNDRRTEPVNVYSLSSGVIEIAAGEFHYCALHVDQGVLCWGNNQNGQLGTASSGNANVPAPVFRLPTAVTSLAGGTAHTCALTAGGWVLCWGDNRNGQLGDGTQVDRSLPTGVFGLPGRATALSAGGNTTCVVVDGQALCWGQNGSGVLSTSPIHTGEDTYNIQAKQHFSPTPVIFTGADTGPGNSIQSLAAGMATTCASLTDGSVWCWGSNDAGQVGDGSDLDRGQAVQVQGLTEAVQSLAPGGRNTCSLSQSGKVICWGDNLLGLLDGSGTTNYPYTESPWMVNLVQNPARALVWGDRFGCVLNAQGGVQCWGVNGEGVLGGGAAQSTTNLVDVVGLKSGVRAIVAGRRHVCALLDSGAVQCWGENAYGQLGDGTSTSRAAPVPVNGLSTGVIGLAAGGNFTCAWQSTTVFCWGENTSGQLGDGTTRNQSTPLAVENITSPDGMALGDQHACALVNKQVQCWGSNQFGQAGGSPEFSNILQPNSVNMINPESDAPVEVSSLTAGAAHICALTSTGEALCWGSNTVGQLGNGRQPDQPLPSSIQVSAAQRIVVYVEGGFRLSAPLVPALTTYIPTPRNLGRDPGILHANLILTIITVFLFTSATWLGVQVWAGQEARIREWLHPSPLRRSLFPPGLSRWIRPALAWMLLGIELAILFGLLFSLQQPGWRLFTGEGLILLFYFTLTSALLGFTGDLVQAFLAWRWQVPVKFNLIPWQAILAGLSGVVSRLLGTNPGLFLGLPRAVQIDTQNLDPNQGRNLHLIRLLPLPIIGLSTWLLSVSAPPGLQSICLLIFAMALQNLFIQLLPLPGSAGKALLHTNWPLWGISIITVTFWLIHSLINPAGDLAKAWDVANVRLMLITGSGLLLLAVTVWLAFEFPAVIRQRVWRSGLREHKALPSEIEIHEPAPLSVDVLEPEPDISVIEQVAPESMVQITQPTEPLVEFPELEAIPESTELARQMVEVEPPLSVEPPAAEPEIKPEAVKPLIFDIQSLEAGKIADGSILAKIKRTLAALTLPWRRVSWHFPDNWRFWERRNLSQPSQQAPAARPSAPAETPIRAVLPEPASTPVSNALDTYAQVAAQSGISPDQELAMQLKPPAPEFKVSEPIQPKPVSIFPESLLYGLNSPDPSARLATVYQLIAIGKPAIQPLIENLSHPDAWVRLMCVAVLGKLAGREAIEALKTVERDRDEGVRYLTAVVLEELQNQARAEQLTISTEMVSKIPIPVAFSVAKSAPVARKPAARVATARRSSARTSRATYPRKPARKSKPPRRKMNPLLSAALTMSIIGFLTIVLLGGIWLVFGQRTGIAELILNPSLLLVSPTPSPTRNPTATSAITPTPFLTPTPTWIGEFAEPLRALTVSQPPTLASDFSSSEGRVLLWNCRGPACMVEGGVMRVTLANTSLLLGGALQAQDFILNFEFTLLESISATEVIQQGVLRVYFRETPGSPDRMAFDLIIPQGEWALREIVGNNEIILSKGQISPISLGELISLQVIAQGPEIAVYSNNRPLTYASVLDLEGTDIWLEVGAATGSLDIAFDNIMFWNVSTPTETP
jgi:alpha-tubulin suppressor-like RCC1 family protein